MASQDSFYSSAPVQSPGKLKPTFQQGYLCGSFQMWDETVQKQETYISFSRTSRNRIQCYVLYENELILHEAMEADKIKLDVLNSVVSPKSSAADEACEFSISLGENNGDVKSLSFKGTVMFRSDEPHYMRDCIAKGVVIFKVGRWHREKSTPCTASLRLLIEES